MNNYQFLVSEREQGRFGEYMRRGLIERKGGGCRGKGQGSDVPVT